MKRQHNGFVEGTEAHLSAVWYVMKEAEADYAKHRARIESGTVNPWYFLNRVRRALGLGTQQVPYSQMREDLLRFAETFGVAGLHPEPEQDTRINGSNSAAAKEFSK